MEVFINGKRYRLDPSDSIGKGGEADVYKLDDQTVVKVFKQPDHPDVVGNPTEEEAARRRIDEHQRKLREFPTIRKGRVVAPMALALDRSGQRILGYAMTFLKQSEVLLRYSERSFRGTAIDNNEVAAIFTDLYETVEGVHDSDVVIGDFNDLNILVAKSQAWLIDCDSWQFGQFFCTVYTEKFVDPLLCDPKADRPMLARPHNKDSDWYAYSVMLMKCLVFCDPYGGVYKPKIASLGIPHTRRPLRRITVFHKDVRYPKPAIPYEALPDDLLQYFHEVFEKDRRGKFPIQYLKNFRWTRCANCQAEHARAICPTCRKVAPGAVKQVVTVRGKVTATRIFKADGEIIFATVQDGDLRYYYRENGMNFREGGVPTSTVTVPSARYRIHGADTLIGVNGKVATLSGRSTNPDLLYVDSFRNVPMFDSNGDKKFWIENGVLMKDGRLAPERIGQVLQSQTLFWVGPKFGFGFYRAAELNVAFVFDCDAHGLNDSVKIPPMNGHVVDSTCFFTDKLCWFMVSLRQEGKAINRCVVIAADGSIQAVAEAEEGDGSWLSTIRGKCAAGKYLFGVTDDGLVRLEVSNGTVVKSAEYPDTEPFVDEGCQLFAGKSGLFVVDRSEIRVLKIS